VSEPSTRRRADLTVAVDVDAPAEDVWAAVTDWPGQGEWMLGTKVEVDGPGDGRSLGARLVAATGVGPLAVRDPMEIVEWDPPRRCVVRHLGAVVQGEGVFEVVGLGPGRAQFAWTEVLELPLGRLGALGWPLVRPLFRLGVRVSLERMARLVAARHRERPGG
jgi:hypothetical protein